MAIFVGIELRATSAALKLVVRDDGEGVDAADARRRAARGASQGMLGMQERIVLAGGEPEIESADGRATIVLVRCPREHR